MKIPRYVVFWLFVAGFLLTALLVLMYTFGYRFSPERGIFVYTGSLTIDSNPQTVDIRINGALVPPNRLGVLNNSAHIAGLTPGEYQIEVGAPGYHPWQKKVIIESGKSTEFWNVLLTKTEAGPNILPGTRTAIRAFPSPEQDLLAVAKAEDGSLSVVTYETDSGVSSEVFSLPDAALLSETEDGIEWSPEAEKLIIPVQRPALGGLREYYLVDVENKASALLPGVVQDGRRKYPRFDPRLRASLLWLDQGTLYRLNTRESTAAPEILRQNLLTYDISASQIYSLKPGGIVSRFPLTDTPNAEEVQITTTPILVDASREYSLVVYDESRLTLREPATGRLWAYNRFVENPLQELRQGSVRGTQFSDDGKKLLFWTDNEVNVSYLREWEVQPTRAAGTTQQIARFTTPLRFVQWTKDYEHVLYALEGQVKVAELDNRDRRNITDFLSLRRPPLQIFSRFEEDHVYVIEDSEGQDRLLQIAFPETPAFFGLGN